MQKGKTKTMRISIKKNDSDEHQDWCSISGTFQKHYILKASIFIEFHLSRNTLCVNISLRDCHQNAMEER